MEPAKLPDAGDQSGLCAGAAAKHAHRCFGHTLLTAAWISAGLLPFFSRRGAERNSLSTGYRAAVGQLSGSGLRVENDSRQRRSFKRFLAICASHERTGGLSSL